MLGLHKRKLWYDFNSYVGDTEVEILFFRARTEIRTFCTALIMRFSSKEISHDGVPRTFYDEFISCKLMLLKRAIVS
jgi:hypothetical protein